MLARLVTHLVVDVRRYDNGVTGGVVAMVSQRRPRCYTYTHIHTHPALASAFTCFSANHSAD